LRSRYFGVITTWLRGGYEKRNRCLSLSQSKWRVTVEQTRGKDVVPVIKQGDKQWKLEGKNPWGIVPVYYIPHERTTSLFGDSEVEGQDALEKEFNSRAANISDLVRATRPGMLWAHDINPTLSVREIKQDDGAVVGYVIDAGRTKNVQGAQAPTLAAIPIPEVPETIAEFPQALVEFWMMVKRISPAVFGMDDTSSGRITGPAETNRMWTSIAHSLTERTNFTEGKTLIQCLLDLTKCRFRMLESPLSHPRQHIFC
jgi:hypothetical protein